MMKSNGFLRKCAFKNTYNACSTAEEVLKGIDLTGKTILLTGCNSGLGFETLRVLTLHGAHVIAAARNLQIAQETCRKVGGNTTPLGCDLGDLFSVKEAIAFIRNYRVDIVIANAGILGGPQLEQLYDLEKQFVINYLSHFMLITGILDVIPDHAGGRIVIVASSAHTNASKKGIEFDNLSGEHGYNAMRFYGQSNVARILFARTLAHRLKDRGITVNALHPGIVTDTNIMRYSGMGMKMITPMVRLFTKNIAQGAATQCYLAAHAEVANMTGKYFSDCKISKTSDVAQDKTLGEHLWAISEQLLSTALKMGGSTK